MSNKFYSDAKEYWEKIPPTVQGMLGGYAHISSADIAGSTKFLRPFIQGNDAKVKTNQALDCGAGIGRITKRLLLPHFETVDMVELVQEYLDAAPAYIGEPNNSRIGRLICSGLQNFEPEIDYYDLIWCQWVLGHLNNDDLEAFFRRIKSGLKENGIIVVKENVSHLDHPEMDKNDSSFTRPKEHYDKLFKKIGFSILKTEKQKNFPKEIYDVWMFALQ